MLFKKNKWGTKYVHMMTSSPLPFLGFLAVGIGALVILCSSIELDVIHTFPAILDGEGPCLVVETDREISAGKVFAYANRNELVLEVRITEALNVGGKWLLGISDGSAAEIGALKGSLSLDIPSGKENLLYRIFVKGGKARG
jgi:hypothetical protein